MVIGLKALSSTCYILSDEYHIPFSFLVNTKHLQKWKKSVI